MRPRPGVLGILLLACVACEDDAVTPPPPPPSAYDDLSQREHVLANLETAYNRRELNEYEKLLCADFTFFFYVGNVGIGGVPALWGRTDELAAHANLFNASYVDTDPSDGTMEACRRILLDIKWEDGVQWQEVPQLNGEDWYSTVVFFNLQIDVGENDHFVNNSGSKAQFTVRNTGTDSEPHWCLVEMRDLDQDLRMSLSSATYQMTWGLVKFVYR